MRPPSTSVISKKNSSQRAKTKPVVENLSVPAQPKRTVSRRTVIMGLGIAGLVVVGGGITWFVDSRKQETLLTTQPPKQGTVLYTYTKHSSGVNSVAWSPDMKRIASGGNEGTMQVWNATDGSRAFTYTGHSNSVFTVAWSPDRQRIASGSLDDTVQVWQAV